MSKTPKSIAPPNPLWLELKSPEDAAGYLSIYYSDDLSSLPVRWITKPGDNKSDPNLETLTYGLFSTCAPGLRAGAVKRRSQYLFFATNRKGTRVLTGYYHLRWYAKGTLGDRDFCLAADEAKFIAKPIPLREVDQECGTNVSKRFRGIRLLAHHECSKFLSLLRQHPDVTTQYLNEIDRLERLSLKYTGYRYPTFKKTDRFSWETASPDFLTGVTAQTPQKVSNSSPSGLWICVDCGRVMMNKALLKRCPQCGKVGTLTPKLVAPPK
jgi:hypothetical protein